MPFGLKPILFSVFEKVSKLIWGRDLGKIPYAMRVYDFIFCRLWPNRNIIEVQGSKIYVDLGADFILRKTFESYIISPTWEEFMTQILKKVVKEGDNVLDLGANLGYYTLLTARLVGSKGKVYAFEPEPRNYKLLTKNIELNGYDNVIATQKAVSDTTGKVKLFLNNRDSGAHTIRTGSDNDEFIEVESVALDEFFKDTKYPINVIKMDIEGAEMAALAGMKRIIRENENLKIFIEFYPPAIREAGNSPEEFVNMLLNDYHFSILAMDDYTSNKQYLRIEKAEDLINLCKERPINLFLEQSQLS